MEQNDYLRMSKDGKTITSCYNHYLGTIVIPSSVKKIKYGAFLGCKGIQKISVDAGNPNYCEKDGALFYKDLTRLILVPRETKHFIIPESVKEIGEGAFDGCTSLTSIEIPSSVTIIREKAFSGCEALSTLTIPNNVKEIWKEAFSGCTNLTTIKIPNIAKIEDKTFAGCKSLTSIEIPNSVTSIGGCAFYGCSNLTSIAVPKSVTSIEAGTFSGCTSLTSIKIPDGVTAIGYKALFGCTSLTSIEIPKTVGVIWDCAFQGCTNLKSVVIHEGVGSMAHQAFSDCTSLTSIKIPSSLTDMTNIVFLGCKKLKEIIVDKGNTSFCSFDGALFSKDMGRLIYVPGGKTTFTLPNNDFDTCYYTYHDCSKLKKLIVAQDHPRLCSLNGVLYSKDGTELVRFPMGNKTIEIPSSVTTIGYGAFANCTRLSSIVIPSNVTEIGADAFQGCTSLTEIHFKHEDPRVLRVQYTNNNPNFGLSSEGKNMSEITLYVPIGTGEAYGKHKLYSQFKEVIEE